MDPHKEKVSLMNLALPKDTLWWIVGVGLFFVFFSLPFLVPEEKASPPTPPPPLLACTLNITGGIPGVFYSLANRVSESASSLSHDNNPPLLSTQNKGKAPPAKQPSRAFLKYIRYVPVPHGQKPNAIRLARAQVLPPVSAIVMHGHLVCAKHNDKPGMSAKYKYGHIDMECCLDPDEIPNPYCDYSVHL